MANELTMELSYKVDTKNAEILADGFQRLYAVLVEAGASETILNAFSDEAIKAITSAVKIEAFAGADVQEKKDKAAKV